MYLRLAAKHINNRRSPEFLFSIANRNEVKMMKVKIVLLVSFLFVLGKSTDAGGSKEYGNTNFPYLGRALAMPSKDTEDCVVITATFPEVFFTFFYCFE